MNTSSITTVLTICLFIVKGIYAQTYEPLDLAKMIFARNNVLNISNYITGEYKGRPNGKDLQNGSITKFTLLGQTSETAVVRMTILDLGGSGVDTYLHFKKDTVWKMNAFRALAMTGILEQAKMELEKMTSQQIDSIIAASKKKKEDEYSIFTSREDYNYRLGNLKLTLELDDNIIKHFVTNKAAFERLKSLALSELEKENADEEISIGLIKNLKPDYQKLFITSVSTGGYELGNCINFLIGGMVDNSVGYMYVTDKKFLPDMDPDRIITIKEIGDGWYIYKTT